MARQDIPCLTLVAIHQTLVPPPTHHLHLAFFPTQVLLICIKETREPSTPTRGEASNPSLQPTHRSVLFSLPLVCIATATNYLIPAKCFSLGVIITWPPPNQLLVSTSQQHHKSSSPRCFDHQVHAHHLGQKRFTDHIRHSSCRKHGQNNRQGQGDLLPAQESRAGIQQRLLGIFVL